MTGVNNMLSREFLNKHGYKKIEWRDKLYSKRNRVNLVTLFTGEGLTREMIFKQYNSRKRQLKETEILFMLKNTNICVPHIYHVVENGLLIEYLKGPTVLDLIEWQEIRAVNSGVLHIQAAVDIIRYLADWLDHFYTLLDRITGKKMIYGDLNCRNFIIRTKLYGLDFEDCRPGRVEEDIAYLIAFLLSYTPEFTLWKKALATEVNYIFASRFNLNKKVLTDTIHDQLELIRERRKKKISRKDLDDLVKAITIGL